MAPAQLLRLLRAAGRRPLELALRHPVLLLLLLRAGEVLYQRLLARRQYWLGRLRIQRKTDEFDGELVQGSLLTCQELLRLGRVEKRTLFVKPMAEVFGADAYLVSELLRGAKRCRRQSSNCLVTRWIPADERYHVLQACLNSVSSLFGENYVHFNALGGEQSELFKSTWYCLTVMTPTDLRESEQPAGGRGGPSGPGADTCTFSDMSRTPRATLRIVIANESELRRIADGKLQQPAWGFFNARHAARYSMLRDFARNFQRQLVSTPANTRGAPTRNPFTSERAHRPGDTVVNQSSGSVTRTRPDGGPMKRVHSQPSLLSPSGDFSNNGPLSKVMRSDEAAVKGGSKEVVGVRSMASDVPERGACEDNCFLRLHVPHFVGEKPAHSPPSRAAVPLPATGSFPVLQPAAPGSAGTAARMPRAASHQAFSGLVRSASPLTM